MRIKVISRFLKFMVIFGLLQDIHCDNTGRFKSIQRGLAYTRKLGQRPKQRLNSWRPICLNQIKSPSPQRVTNSSVTTLSSREMQIFSNPKISGDRAPDGRISLAGTPPEYFEALATDAQNATTQISSYNGMPGGMDLFGIRSMFVSSSAPSISSDFGSNDLHHFI